MTSTSVLLRTLSFAIAMAFWAGVSPAAAVSLLEQHVLAQQGLSIGLAGSFVKAEFAVVEASSKINKCAALDGGGSLKILSASRTGNTAKGTVDVYYDAKCKTRYMDASFTATKTSTSTLSGSENATIYDMTGHVLAKTNLNIAFALGTEGVANISMVGKFTPTGLSAVDLGLICTDPLLPTTTSTCSVGIAQTSAAVHADIASITPATIKVNPQNGGTIKVTAATLAQGSMDTLGISSPNPATLKITGADTKVGNASASGSFHRFSIEPVGPTSWTSTDSANGAKFAISLASGGSTFAGTIKATATDKTLAKISVDRSGTGTITYSNNLKVNISSWVIAR